MDSNFATRHASHTGRGSGRGEEGSALLIVLVFAAIVAIMLYRALPDVYFEGQRQKEQLLIDRGNEYKTAIKRFVTKNQRFPTSLDQLDNFNNVRYLRHRYKDPMTGKSEWRLIHVMGPGFVLTDSKVTQPNANGSANANGASGAANQNGTAASANQGGFGNSSSSFGTSNSGTGGFGASNPGTGNSTSASSGSGGSNSGFGSGGFGNSGAFGSSFEQNQADSTGAPQATAAQLYGAHRRPAPAPSHSMPGQEGSGNADQSDADKPLPEPGAPAAQQTENGAPGSAAQPSADGSQPGAKSPDGSGIDPNNPAGSALRSVNAALRQQQPIPQQASSFSNSNGATISNGAIAGVASTGKGSTIKVLDKQKDYSKWEFVYDPQQDAAKQMQGALGGNGAPNAQNPNGNSAIGSSTNTGNSSGGFGQGTANIGFGPSSPTSSFGTSTNSQASPANTNTNTNTNTNNQ